MIANFPFPLFFTLPACPGCRNPPVARSSPAGFSKTLSSSAHRACSAATG
nr:MAG TPA: Protein of unknown function (DUF2847) [Caudoviricetes sp.]